MENFIFVFSKERNTVLSHAWQLSAVQVRNNSACGLTSEARCFDSDRNLIEKINL